MGNNIKEILDKHYANIDEENRLVRDKAHYIEFLTTIKYIDKYLKQGDRILEIGAATGRYSLYYAKKGFQVDAIDLVQSNLKILESKITKEMNIKAMQGNALNLSMYKDNIFDITLVLGPLYHLFSQEEKEEAIKEAIRVTKQGGKIFFAYITNEAVILSYGLRKGNLLKLKEICDENYKVKDIPNEVFSANFISEIEKTMKKFPIKKLKNIATDGLAPNLANYINNLSEEEYNVWLDYHFKNCEREDLLSVSSHILYICKKIKTDSK